MPGSQTAFIFIIVSQWKQEFYNSDNGIVSIFKICIFDMFAFVGNDSNGFRWFLI
jgi:hypothetical protein